MLFYIKLTDKTIIAHLVCFAKAYDHLSQPNN